MATNSKKLSQLTVTNNVASTDRILILKNPSGVPVTRTVDISTLGANLVFSNSAPANSSANGITGTITYDSSYVYICVANNTWKRSAISTW